MRSFNFFRLIVLILLTTPLNLSLNAQSSIDTTKVDSVMEAGMKKYRIPGATIGIFHKDELIKVSAYGLADIQNKAPIMGQTSFELASISKQFTATAILLLQQRGRLNLDDPISKHFPEAPQNWNAIKIKHLLWHTSGLPGMFPRDKFMSPGFSGYKKMTSEELDLMMQTNTISKKNSIQSIITDTLDFEPGEYYNYSDVGYLVLGLIIDNITGSYNDFLTEELFQPLEMNNTYFLQQEAVINYQARGYSLKNGDWINIMRYWDYEIPSFFGAFSNINDLYLWDKALNNHSILNKESTQLLFSKGILNNGSTIDYGCGWQINDINGMRIIQHGGITGVNYIKIPSQEISVVTLTNLGYNGNDIVESLNITPEIVSAIGIDMQTNKNHVTTTGAKVIKTKKSEVKKITGKYITIGNVEAEIQVKNDIPIFVCAEQDMKNEMALLSDGSWLVLGLNFEYILTFDSSKKTLTSNYNREFHPVSK
ncbi:beta-lactamase family protein [bacterium SCSIO 12643]|nr:beta-lactamase family protein [bacterium SCSIO 12643]